MRKSPRGSRYLRQLAQPVAPGQTVLTARAAARTGGAETAPVVPVIEDHVAMRTATAGRRDSAPRIEAEPPALRPAGLAAVEAAERPMTMARARAAMPAAEGHAETARAHDAPREQRRDAAGHETGGESGLRELAVEQEASGGSPRDEEPGGHVERMDAPTHARAAVPRLSHAEENAARLLAESREAARRSEQAEAARATESADAGQAMTPREQPAEPAVEAPKETALASRAPQQRQAEARGEARAESGSETRGEARAGARSETRTDAGAGARVHIGTVEIRMALPPAAAPQVAPAPSRPQENAGGQARGRAGSAEPLARGLAWTYGLVQG